MTRMPVPCDMHVDLILDMVWQSTHYEMHVTTTSAWEDVGRSGARIRLSDQPGQSRALGEDLATRCGHMRERRRA